MLISEFQLFSCLIFGWNSLRFMNQSLTCVPFFSSLYFFFIQINSVQALAKCTGWQVLSSSTYHLGCGPVEPLGNATGCLLANCVGDKFIGKASITLLWSKSALLKLAWWTLNRLLCPILLLLSFNIVWGFPKRYVTLS